MTDEEVMKRLGDGSPLDRARQIFSSWSARIEQAGQQRKPISPIEIRRLEFLAVKAIAKELELDI